MNVEEVREICLSMPHATEDMPFGESVLAVRVGGKIFTLIDLEKAETLNLKCDPEKAIELREEYSGIIPGYHMNKVLWNTVYFNQIPVKLLKELIQHSYELILNSITKNKRKELGI
jgi:predicted DNA-binding protein (MmcQ/YjbR family)